MVVEQMKEKQDEDREKEAQIPLEEAAPTPSDKDDAVKTDELKDTEEKAGAAKVRLAQIDDDQVRLKENIKKQEHDAQVELADQPIVVTPEEREEKKEQVINRLKKVVEDDATHNDPNKKDQIEALVDDAINEDKLKDEALRKQHQKVQAQIGLDADEQAALEERQRHLAKEAEAGQA
jgi:hypothetical protein